MKEQGHFFITLSASAEIKVFVVRGLDNVCVLYRFLFQSFSTRDVLLQRIPPLTYTL